MRALLDVNVLIALLDADHVSHRRAADWLEVNAKEGWASCPISENGCIRIMSHPAYPNSFPTAVVVERLREAATGPLHEFWPDDISLLDDAVVDPARVHGPRQITDVYLLALAVRNGGRLVTFDNGISREAARQSARRHLLVL